MGYQKALEQAGAEVLKFEEFGSYQGDWWALVKYEGKAGWINGSYGSCSGCDAFQSEFGWFDDEKPDYKERLAEFGRGYLDNIYTQDEAEKEAEKNLDWDYDAKEMIEYIKSNAIKED